MVVKMAHVCAKGKRYDSVDSQRCDRQYTHNGSVPTWNHDDMA